MAKSLKPTLTTWRSHLNLHTLLQGVVCLSLKGQHNVATVVSRTGISKAHVAPWSFHQDNPLVWY